MTILCITAERLPGVRPCTHLGLHTVACLDHEGNREDLRPGTCRGCLPRTADVGYLCRGCYERVSDAVFRWAQFRRMVIETGGRAVSPEGGRKGSTPDGYTNLPLTTLTLDECDRLLRSQHGQTIDLWVHTPDGARDAVMFAAAAHRAYRTVEVEKRELRLERVRCPHCDMLSLSANPTSRRQGVTVVECQHCGELLDTVKDDRTRWVGSEACEHAGHVDCRNLECRCDCHHIGRASTEQGVSALWDADQHTAGYVDRAGWMTDGRTVWQAVEERKSA